MSVHLGFLFGMLSQEQLGYRRYPGCEPGYLLKRRRFYYEGYVTTKDGTCIEFNTVSVTTNTKGSHHRKRGYVGKAEYFAVYLPDNGKVYMISVDEAPKSGGMTLRFKKAGLVRGNHKKTYIVPYEEINDPRFNWAEDYEI